MFTNAILLLSYSAQLLASVCRLTGPTQLTWDLVIINSKSGWLLYAVQDFDILGEFGGCLRLGLPVIFCIHVTPPCPISY